MKHFIFLTLTVLLAISCASTPEKKEKRNAWSNGREKERSFQEQRRQEQQETIRDQNPSFRPNF